MSERILPVMMMGMITMACASAPAHAQERFSLGESMECFRETTVNLGDPCSNGATPVAHVVYHWRDWDPNLVDQVAASLVSAAGSTDSDLSLRAINALALMGSEFNGKPGRPGTVEDLREAFLTARHPEKVIGTMAMQSDTSAVVEFLAEVVRGDHRPEAVASRRLAALSLSRAGVEGASRLRGIQRQGIADPSVSREVDRLILEID